MDKLAQNGKAQNGKAQNGKERYKVISIRQIGTERPVLGWNAR